jgi:hypothetical protein
VCQVEATRLQGVALGRRKTFSNGDLAACPVGRCQQGLLVVGLLATWITGVNSELLPCLRFAILLFLYLKRIDLTKFVTRFHIRGRV